ncbi:serine hydrolase domain-containing protein, partial [Streptomyces sp. NPDC059717]|uniref:serine hydrolase domain-containing protein n=1 Tax=Streptomyces sp. NPDC059717 TaxID=3346922 RepID=UPI003683A543
MTRDAIAPSRPTRRRGRWVTAPLCAAGAAAAVLAPGATAFAAGPHTAPSPTAALHTAPGRPWAGDHAVQQAARQLTGAGLPGAIALIQNHGRTAMAAAGYANLATKRPMTTADHLRIGSSTKAFTATLVLQLVAEGRLGLDDTVQQFLPGIIKGGDHITVRQLLNLDPPRYRRLRSGAGTGKCLVTCDDGSSSGFQHARSARHFVSEILPHGRG